MIVVVDKCNFYKMYPYQAKIKKIGEKSLPFELSMSRYFRLGNIKLFKSTPFEIVID